MTPRGIVWKDAEGRLRVFATKVFARAYTEEQIARAVTETELKEVMCDDQDKE